MLTHKDTSETALAFLKDRLVRATDVTSEAVAALDAVVEGNRESTERSVAEHLHKVHGMLWEIRWECFADLDDVIVKKSGGAS